MEISIINVLDNNYTAKEGVAVKIIIQKNENTEIIFSGKSDDIGQVIITHQYQGLVSLFFEEIFHSDLSLPCFKTIALKR